jgi:hypothetical protein
LKTSAVGTIKCTATTLGGVMAAVSPEALLDPEFTGCAITGAKAKFRSNSCDYSFKVANVVGSYSGSLVLSCVGSDQLEFEAEGCTVKLPAQTLAAVSYEATGFEAERKVTAQLSGAGIKYTVGSGCYATPGSYSDGTLSGSTILEAIF